jgi:hypothetical protein
MGKDEDVCSINAAGAGLGANLRPALVALARSRRHRVGRRRVRLAWLSRFGRRLRRHHEVLRRRRRDDDQLTRSALLLQAPRPHPPLASSLSKNPVVFAPTENNARHRPPKSHQRSVRDPKIPIGRAAPNQTEPFPTRGFLLARLSDAGPASSPARLQRAGVRNPSAKLPHKVVRGMARFDAKTRQADASRIKDRCSRRPRSRRRA